MYINVINYLPAIAFSKSFAAIFTPCAAFTSRCSIYAFYNSSKKEKKIKINK